MSEYRRGIDSVFRLHMHWVRGYFACSTGNVSDEMIRAYIERHTETEDRFQVIHASDFESSRPDF